MSVLILRSLIFALGSFIALEALPSQALDMDQIGPTPRYASQVLESAMSDLRSRGKSADEYWIQVSDKLSRGELQYLEFKGVRDLRDVWVVNLLPKQEKVEGGSYSYFFRYPSIREFEVWVGE